MGFEVYYHFKEKLEGCYEKSETKSFKKRVGDPFEEVPLAKLASSITAQLARRDIFISDVEIYELSKKSVSFKETKGGIVIKNKKFIFDSSESSMCLSDTSDVELETPEKAEEAPCQEVQSPKVQSCPHNAVQTKRVIDHAVFSPEPHQTQEIRSKGLRLTLDKRYEIFGKRASPSGIGDLYLLNDDAGREQWVSDLYFVPASVNLFADRELGFSSTENKLEDSRLLWGGASVDSGMPDLRRR